MKRIKSVNGYTIYEATSARDEANYNCRVGSYNIYISSDIRDFGLSNSYPEYEDIDSLSVAEAMCGASQYAVACDLAEEISGSTAQDMDLVLAIEARLEAGEALEAVRASFEEALELGHYPDEDIYGEDELDDMDLEDQFDALLESGDRADAQHSDSEQDIALFVEAGILSEAMQAAGYAFDEINSTPSFLTFDGDWGTRLWFSNWAEVREWLDGVVFDDDEVSDKVERILHPEHFAALDELNARLAAEQEVDIAALAAAAQHSGAEPEQDEHYELDIPEGKAAFYFTSDVNAWMGMVLVVDRDKLSEAEKLAIDGLTAFYEELGDEGLCFGDCVEQALREAGIDYSVVYPDDCSGDELSDTWEAFASQFETVVY